MVEQESAFNTNDKGGDPMIYLCFCYNAHRFFSLHVYFKLLLHACCRTCETAPPGGHTVRCVTVRNTGNNLESFK